MKVLLNILLVFLTGGLWLIVLLVVHLTKKPKVVVHIKNKRCGKF